MRTNWVLGILLLSAGNASAGECLLTAVLGNSSVATPAVLARAKVVAGEIFAGIGVDLRWSRNASSEFGRCSNVIEVQLELSTDPNDRPDSLAYAALSGTGRGIHVFFDRVSAMVPAAALGTLLGHVFAHEMAHILEGVPRHSAAGVMKARWDRKDVHDLVYRPLRFALVDDALIHAGLASEPAGPVPLAVP